MADSETNLAYVEVPQPEKAAARLLAAEKLDSLFAALGSAGLEIIGPTVRDGAIVLDRIDSSADLPEGWTDEQKPGEYRLKKQSDPAVFNYGPGPQSWKKHLHPAEIRLLAAERQNGTFHILNNGVARSRPLALLGVRACELAAIAIQDRVLTGDRYRDAIYSQRREGAFIIAVQCTRSRETCFCSSMGTGPQVQTGFDLALTELIDGPGGHRFLVQAGSERGKRLLAGVETEPATEQDTNQAEAAVALAAHDQKRSIDGNATREALLRKFEHPHWDEIAKRCLSCANCTMVCPTCFCTNVEDVSDIAGNHAERWRRWDSCFTLNFSYIHGGSIRSSATARYRQWMSHKLAWWMDQFGTSGCVGCGRCITWCPAGIDITEESRTFCEGDKHGNS